MNMQSPDNSPRKAAVKTELTPMMAQYIEIKTANPDSLLFYRMGDFYELFFEDAEEASRVLGITLTKRGKHLGEDIPMCGVPVHTADDYLQRLITAGYRVSVCEQVEDPAEAKKRGSKSVVKRDVKRLVTPGTLTEDSLLEANHHNYLAALARIKGDTEGAFALAWAELSTGAFHVTTSTPIQLEADLARVDPSELLVSEAIINDADVKTMLRHVNAAVVGQASAFFDSTTADERITRIYKIASLDAFGTFTRTEKAAIAAVLSYIEKTQIDHMPRLDAPAREGSGGVMLIDPATRANLEISRTLSGDKKGALLHAVNRTVTGAGARLVAERLSSPALDLGAIRTRHDAVAWFVDRRSERAEIRDLLKNVPDILRCLSRIGLDRGSPRDLAAIGIGLTQAEKVRNLIRQGRDDKWPDLLQNALDFLQGAPEELPRTLSRALKQDLPLLKRDGGFIATGYDKALDETVALRDENRTVVAGLQGKYASLTGVKNLKVKHNNVLGFFLEVTAQYGARFMEPPLNETFIHRQTLANAMRFTTTELAELQTRIVNAADQALGLELQIFDTLADEVLSNAEAIGKAARALAELDVASAHADCAERWNYCRPIVDDSHAFVIEKGRHPVVEQALADQLSDPFVANDCALSSHSVDNKGDIWLVTGPNMAGKSTFLRQNALIAIMAQAGMFVPAESAHIGLVDRLFSRVGAADDLARGRSTFMVEMVETAAILNQAGARSLVILDEIGRGTATFDGLSIAWAAIEHLHEVNGSRALFATHYHELTSLSDVLNRLTNVTVKVREWQGKVVFLHEIAPGVADGSYGIQVAKLAGLPDAVIARANAILKQLEASAKRDPATLIDDLPLFSAAQRTTEQESDRSSPALDMLRTLKPDELSPREALEALYQLKAVHDESSF